MITKMFFLNFIHFNNQRGGAVGNFFVPPPWLPAVNGSGAQYFYLCETDVLLDGLGNVEDAGPLRHQEHAAVQRLQHRKPV